MSSTLTFMCGCAINRDMYYIACVPDEWYEEHGDEEPYTVMCFYQEETAEKWFCHSLPDWRVVSCVYPEPAAGSVRKVYALSDTGEIECFSREGSVIEKISDAENYGNLSAIRFIGTRFYVCGDEGQVYRKEGKKWVHFDKGLLGVPIAEGAKMLAPRMEKAREQAKRMQETPAFAEFSKLQAAALEKMAQRQAAGEDIDDILDEMASFDYEQLYDPEGFHDPFEDLDENMRLLHDINGLCEESIYVVGFNGFIAHFNGLEWRILEPVTRAHLGGIDIFSEDEIYITGSLGMGEEPNQQVILRGNAREGFKVWHEWRQDTEFYAIAHFDHHLYISGSDGIYALKDEKITRQKISDTEVMSLEVKDGVLWALSSNKLFRLKSGGQWEVFVHPNNAGQHSGASRQ